MVNRNILIITINQFLTNLADSIFQIVLFWYVYHHTGSALSASLVTTISFSVQIFLSPIIGVFSDKLKPLNSMQLSFFILAVVGIIFAPVYFFFKSLIIIYIYVGVAIHSSCMILEISSKNRLIPIFVGEENVVKVNGYISSSGNVASLLGNLLGGGILTVLSFAGVMLIHSGLYLIAAITLMFLIKVSLLEDITGVEKNVNRYIQVKKPHFFSDLFEGWKLLKSNRPLLKLIILSSVLNISMINSSQLVVLVSNQYKGSSAAYGLFSMFGVLSSILIGLVISKLTTRFKASLLFIAGLVISGTATAFMGLTHILAIGVILNMLVLASSSILRITFNSFMMIFVEDKFRGRMMSIAISLSAIIVPVVSVLGGYLSDHVGVGFVYILSGSWICIWALFPLFDKDIQAINFDKQNRQNQHASL